MKNVIAVYLLVHCACAFSNSREVNLECQYVSGSSSSVVLSFQKDVFHISDADRGCKSQYVYSQLLEPAKGVMITAYPGDDDLGLNAQNLIYFVPDGANQGRYVGSIPASADEIGENVYRDIVQVGGSVYENKYKVGSDKVDIIFPVRELIFSDTQCLYEKTDSGSCAKMEGTIKHPLCVVNDGKRKIVIKAEECADMKNQG